MTPNDYQQRYRQKCKIEGRCVACGKPLDEDKTMCKSCRDKYNKSRKELYRFYQENGICPRCRKEPLYNGKKWCEECYSKKYAYEAKRGIKYDTSKYNEKRKELSRKRKTEGLCVICGRKAQEGRTRCPSCLTKDRLRHREKYTVAEYRKEHGLCRYCGEPAKEGYQMCETHYQRQCEQLAKVRPKRNEYWARQRFGKVVNS